MSTRSHGRRFWDSRLWIHLQSESREGALLAPFQPQPQTTCNLLVYTSTVGPWEARMTNQSNSLYAAIHAADFPAQAIMRLRPDLHAQSVAILDGVAPQERVCSLNLRARKLGVAIGMTRLEIEELNLANR